MEDACHAQKPPIVGKLDNQTNRINKRLNDHHHANRKFFAFFELNATATRTVLYDAFESMTDFAKQRNAFGALRSVVDEKNTEICPSGHLKPKSTPECVYCSPVVDEKEPCYTCTECVADRTYLGETDSQFVLVGHECFGWPIVELWYCNKCKNNIAIEQYRRGMMRDVVHVNARKLHTQYVCKGLQSGRYSLN